MSAKLFEAALGIAEAWFIQGVDFDAAKKTLTIGVDFVAGSRFAVPVADGAHPAHDFIFAQPSVVVLIWIRLVRLRSWDSMS